MFDLNAVFYTDAGLTGTYHRRRRNQVRRLAGIAQDARQVTPAQALVVWVFSELRGQPWRNIDVQLGQWVLENFDLRPMAQDLEESLQAGVASLPLYQLLVLDNRYVALTGNDRLFDLDQLDWVTAAPSPARLSISLNLTALYLAGRTETLETMQDEDLQSFLADECNDTPSPNQSQ